VIARCALGECNAELQTVCKSETILNETNQAGQVLVNALTGKVKVARNHLYDYPTNQASGITSEFPVIQEQSPTISEMPHLGHTQKTAILVWP
jgi:hypothetical protein